MNRSMNVENTSSTHANAELITSAHELYALGVSYKGWDLTVAPTTRRLQGSM